MPCDFLFLSLSHTPNKLMLRNIIEELKRSLMLVRIIHEMYELLLMFLRGISLDENLAYFEKKS